MGSGQVCRQCRGCCGHCRCEGSVGRLCVAVVELAFSGGSGSLGGGCGRRSCCLGHCCGGRQWVVDVSGCGSVD